MRLHVNIDDEGLQCLLESMWVNSASMTTTFLTFFNTQDPQKLIVFQMESQLDLWPDHWGDSSSPPCPHPIDLSPQMKRWTLFLTSSNCLLLFRLRWEGWMKVCKATTPYSKRDHRCNSHSITSLTMLNNPFQGFIQGEKPWYVSLPSGHTQNLVAETVISFITCFLRLCVRCPSTSTLCSQTKNCPEKKSWKPVFHGNTRVP